MSIEQTTNATGYQSQAIGGARIDGWCGLAEHQNCPDRPASFLPFLEVVAEDLKQDINRKVGSGIHATSVQLNLIRQLIRGIEQGAMPEPRCRDEFMDLVSVDHRESTMLAAENLWDVYEVVCSNFPKENSSSQGATGRTRTEDHAPTMKSSMSIEPILQDDGAQSEYTNNMPRLSVIEFLTGAEKGLLSIKDGLGPFDRMSSIQLHLVRKLLAQIRHTGMLEPRCRERFIDLLPRDMSLSDRLAANDLWDFYEQVCATYFSEPSQRS